MKEDSKLPTADEEANEMEIDDEQLRMTPTDSDAHDNLPKDEEKKMDIDDNEELLNMLPLNATVAGAVSNSNNVELVEPTGESQDNQAEASSPVNDDAVTDSMSKDEKSNSISINESDENTTDSETGEKFSADNEQAKDNVRAGGLNESIVESRNMNTFIADSRAPVNMSIDEEKLSLMGNFDLTLTDVVLNDEANDSIADVRSIQRMMSNSSFRRPADAASVSQVMKSMNDNTIVEEESSTPDNQTQTTTVPVDGDDLKLKNSSDNKERSTVDDKMPRDRTNVERNKTNLSIDNKKPANIVPNKKSDDGDWAVKPPIVPGMLPKSLNLPPVVAGTLPVGQPSVPIVGSNLVGKLPVNTGMTKELSINSNKREKSISSVTSKSIKKNSFVNGQGNGTSVDGNRASPSLSVSNKNLGAVESNERPASAVSSGSQKARSIMSRTNTEHTIVNLNKVTDVSAAAAAAAQKPEGTQITNESTINSTANFESVVLSTNTTSTEKLSVTDEKPKESTIQGEETDAPLEFYKKMKFITMADANTENQITTNGKSEEMQADDFANLLNKTTVSKFDVESLDVTIANQSLEMLSFENETLGALSTFPKRSSVTTAGRRVRQLSFIDSAHVIQINSSKESHMRALPSEKFWRRNQRRVSTMAHVEEVQTAKK